MPHSSPDKPEPLAQKKGSTAQTRATAAQMRATRVPIWGGTRHVLASLREKKGQPAQILGEGSLFWHNRVSNSARPPQLLGHPPPLLARPCQKAAAAAPKRARPAPISPANKYWIS